MDQTLADLNAHADELRQEIADAQQAMNGDDFMAAEAARKNLPRLQANLTSVLAIIQKAQPKGPPQQTPGQMAVQSSQTARNDAQATAALARAYSRVTRPDGSVWERDPDTNQWTQIMAPATIQESGGTTSTVVNPADQGTNPSVDTPAAVPVETPGKTVTQAQATYDRQVQIDAENRRQQAIANQRADEAMAIQRANQLWTQQQDAIVNAYHNRELDLTQARDQANQAYQKIQAQLEAERNQISARAVDATLRGQDINAGVSQRGQDISMIDNLADIGSRNAMQALASYVAPGQMTPFNQAMAAMGTNQQVKYAPTTPGNFPFNPFTLAVDQANLAKSAVPAQYSTPPPPAPVNVTPPQQYATPAAPQGAAA